LTSTSPFTSASAMCRIGGMTTVPEASAVKARSIVSITLSSSATARRSSVSVRIKVAMPSPSQGIVSLRRARRAPSSP
jgi:hypothetical protein